MKLLFAAMLPLVVSGGLVWAQAGGASTHTNVSKENREKMAVQHEKMAACLRSDKSFDDCHNEMRTACEKNKEACPMMGMGHKGMKMHKMGHPSDAKDK